LFLLYSVQVEQAFSLTVFGNTGLADCKSDLFLKSLSMILWIISSNKTCFREVYGFLKVAKKGW